MKVIERIKSILFGNLIIKVFSLLFALVLWFHVVAKGKSEVTFVVPLELTEMPQEMAVVGDVPGYVDVRLVGPEGMLKGLSPKEVRAALSLSDSKEGEQVLYLGPSNVTVPGYVQVASISPVEIKLRLEALARKDLPVSPVLTGRPAKGYRVVRVETDPDKVVAVGPRSLMARIYKVETKPVDIEGAMGGLDKLVLLEPPGVTGVRLEQEGVRVAVELVRARK